MGVIKTRPYPKSAFYWLPLNIENLTSGATGPCYQRGQQEENITKENSPSDQWNDSFRRLQSFKPIIIFEYYNVPLFLALYAKSCLVVWLVS